MDLKSLIAPKHFNLASEISKHVSDKIALHWENELGESRTITYAELNSKANKLANGLTRLGLVKGDRVVVMTTRLIESYIIYLACLKARKGWCDQSTNDGPPYSSTSRLF
ncbi:AMP-binding protein [Neobacillus jeddahensis]|uniref:AMP-binding protein n=1 Tax=Neobacillus jeddahensis TaxID=1461580 RepID=UPI00058DA2ED